MLLTGCKKEILNIYSTDNKHKLTVITDGDVRYVISGEHKEVPENNFIKLDVSGVTELSDAIYICWPSQNASGEIVIPNSSIIENRMPIDLFKFEDRLPKDNKGIPRPTKFSENGCTTVDFLRSRPYPEGSSTVLKN